MQTIASEDALQILFIYALDRDFYLYTLIIAQITNFSRLNINMKFLLKFLKNYIYV